MCKTKFIRDLSNLLKEYRVDRLTGFDSVRLSRIIYDIIFDLYILPPVTRRFSHDD